MKLQSQRRVLTSQRHSLKPRLSLPGDTHCATCPTVANVDQVLRRALAVWLGRWRALHWVWLLLLSADRWAEGGDRWWWRAAESFQWRRKKLQGETGNSCASHCGMPGGCFYAQNDLDKTASHYSCTSMNTPCTANSLELCAQHSQYTLLGSLQSCIKSYQGITSSSVLDSFHPPRCLSDFSLGLAVFNQICFQKIKACPDGKPSVQIYAYQSHESRAGLLQSGSWRTPVWDRVDEGVSQSYLLTSLSIYGNTFFVGFFLKMLDMESKKRKLLWAMRERWLLYQQTVFHLCPDGHSLGT